MEKHSVHTGLQDIVKYVATALEEGMIAKNDETVQARIAFDKATAELTKHVPPDGKKVKLQVGLDMKRAHENDKEATEKRKELWKRFVNFKDRLLEEKPIKVKRWGNILYNGFMIQEDLRDLKLNLSQPLDIALALLIRFSDINVADNPHFYLSLGQELGKRAIREWIHEPLKYGEPLDKILQGSVTLFIVADRNIHIIQKPDPATSRIFRNIWQTEKINGEDGAIILKDVRGILESSDRVQPPNLSYYSPSGDFVPVATWEAMLSESCSPEHREGPPKHLTGIDSPTPPVVPLTGATKNSAGSSTNPVSPSTKRASLSTIHAGAPTGSTSLPTASGLSMRPADSSTPPVGPSKHTTSSSTNPSTNRASLSTIHAGTPTGPSTLPTASGLSMRPANSPTPPVRPSKHTTGSSTNPVGLSTTAVGAPTGPSTIPTASGLSMRPADSSTPPVRPSKHTTGSSTNPVAPSTNPVGLSTTPVGASTSFTPLASPPRKHSAGLPTNAGPPTNPASKPTGLSTGSTGSSLPLAGPLKYSADSSTKSAFLSKNPVGASTHPTSNPLPGSSTRPTASDSSRPSAASPMPPADPSTNASPPPADTSTWFQRIVVKPVKTYFRW